ncbi:uroporphyrinogen-III synthase [Bacillaceae bacterium Marseille-Q3522]|nr:uroporphyrinogen-III synthase [Bacillaceae bacterium Marseille-Q3522]
MTSLFPLAKKKVLIPRAKEADKSFAALVTKYGGIPLEIPLLDFRPLRLEKKQLILLGNLHQYDWLIFTSKVTVEYFFSFCDLSKMKPHPKIAVIGRKTKELLEQKNVFIDFIPAKYNAEQFVCDFLPVLQQGMKVLFPKGKMARTYITEMLQKNGVNVNELILYETVFPKSGTKKLASLLRQQEVDILLFTSPSTVDHFMEVVTGYSLQAQVKNCSIAVIGPTTKRQAEKHQLQVQIMPSSYTIHDMMMSVADYFADSGG